MQQRTRLESTVAWAVLGVVALLAVMAVSLFTAGNGIGSRPAKSSPTIKEMPVKKVRA